MVYVSRKIFLTKEKYIFLLDLNGSRNTMLQLRDQGFQELDSVALENLCGLGTDAVQGGLNLENLKTKSEPVA